jgi:hypothetical protein
MEFGHLTVLRPIEIIAIKSGASLLVNGRLLRLLKENLLHFACNGLRIRENVEKYRYWW